MEYNNQKFHFLNITQRFISTHYLWNFEFFIKENHKTCVTYIQGRLIDLTHPSTSSNSLFTGFVSSFNPRTQTLGDFHPTLCYPRDYCTGSFPCGTILPNPNSFSARCAFSKRGCVIELAPWDFATECISGGFHRRLWYIV